MAICEIFFFLLKLKGLRGQIKKQPENQPDVYHKLFANLVDLFDFQPARASLESDSFPISPLFPFPAFFFNPPSFQFSFTLLCSNVK